MTRIEEYAIVLGTDPKGVEYTVGAKVPGRVDEIPLMTHSNLDGSVLYMMRAIGALHAQRTGHKVRLAYFKRINDRAEEELK